MLTLAHLHKQVDYYESLMGKKPTAIYAYVRELNYQMVLIPVSDFELYEFVEYTYQGSYCPVVIVKSDSKTIKL